MIKLSFIIPVYNVEKYIQECFMSIYEQLNDECEIILVDDGSTDSSKQICDELYNNYNCVKVIHKTNGGLASARNAGIFEAAGNYICFVDSDDRIAPNCVKEIINTINTIEFDMCFMPGIKFYVDGDFEDLGDEIESSKINNINKNEILEYISSRPKFSGSACTKIYRYKFLIDNNLLFPSDNRQSEDLGFVRDCIMLAEKYYALDCPYYEYRQSRIGSITYGATPRAVDGVLKFIEDTVKLYSFNNRPQEPYGHIALSFAAYEYYIALLNYALLPNNIENKQLYTRIKDVKWVVKFSHSSKYKIIGIFLNVFGVKLTSSLLAKFYKNQKK